MGEIQVKLTPLDVDGKMLQIGDRVAFCLGGTGTVMKLGEVIKVTAKQVLIQHRGSNQTTQRAFDAVAKIGP